MSLVPIFTGVLFILCFLATLIRALYLFQSYTNYRRKVKTIESADREYKAALNDFRKTMLFFIVTILFGILFTIAIYSET